MNLLRKWFCPSCPIPPPCQDLLPNQTIAFLDSKGKLHETQNQADAWELHYRKAEKLDEIYHFITSLPDSYYMDLYNANEFFYKHSDKFKEFFNKFEK